MLLQLDQAGGRERAALAGCSSRDAVAAKVSLPHHGLLPPPIFIPFSPVCFFLALILPSEHPFCLSHLAAPLHPNVLFIASSFLVFNTQTYRFYFRKAQRRGKATSMNFLDHFSTEEYNNYFSVFLFSCSDPMQGPALSPHRHTVSARMLHAIFQFLQPPSLMAAVQVPVGCSWAHMRSPPQKCCPSSSCSPKSLAYL